MINSNNDLIVIKAFILLSHALLLLGNMVFGLYITYNIFVMAFGFDHDKAFWFLGLWIVNLVVCIYGTGMINMFSNKQ